jgi:hypothetical protein
MFIAGSASATFVGWFFESYAVEANGTSYAVIDAFAQFDNATDTVLNVFNAQISITDGTGFHHNDFNTLSGLAGAWNVTGSGNIPGVVDAAIDSFVLIGGVIGGTNSTSLDPSFSPSTGPFIATDAGWFNSNPPSLQGRVNADTLRTWVARFVSVGTDTARSLSFAANMGYNQGLGTPAQFAFDNGQGFGPTSLVAFVPAPGAIALLGMAGLLGSRRRRG